MTVTTDKTCECMKCGYIWTPRVGRLDVNGKAGNKPKSCPACKSYRWDVEIRVENDNK